MRLAIVSVTLFAAQLLGGVNQWTSRGPSGGSVTTIVADRSNPNIVYIGTYGGGIFKSEDAGVSWRAVNEGLSDPSVISLVIRHDRPATLFAGTTRGAVMRTRDGGASWTETIRLPGGIWSLAFDQRHGSLFTLASGSFDLMRSDDDGDTWQTIPQQQRLERLAAMDGKLYGVVDRALFVSDNGGSDWTTLLAIGDPNVSLAVDEERSTIVIGSRGFITRSVDAGKNWERLVVSAPLDSQEVVVYALAPYAGGVVMATSAGVLRYADGTGWTPVGDAGKATSVILRTEANGEHIFAFNWDTSLLYDWKSARPVWRPVDTGLQSASTQDVAVAGASVYAATWQGLATHSTDSESWRAIDVASSPTVHMQSVKATSSGVVLVGNSSGLHKSDDGGATWKLSAPKTATAIGISPSDQKTIYAALSNAMSKSTDGGDTWRSIQNDMPLGYYFFYYGFYSPSIEVDRSDADIVYVCYEHLYKSIDGGVHWKPILQAASAIAIDSANPSLLYATDYRGNVWVSSNAGASWQSPDVEGDVVALATDPARASVVYAGTSAGNVYRSVNGGRRWSKISDGLSGAYINKLALDSSGNRLYAATSGGVFEYLRDTTYLAGATKYSVSLQTYFANFVSADDCGDGRVVANASSAGPCETFTLYDVNGGALTDGDQIYIQAPNGSFLGAENGGSTNCRGCDTRVNANRAVARAWETFTIHAVGGIKSAIGDGAKISLQGIAGGYLSAEDGGSNGCGGCDSAVNANRVVQNAWETFTIRIR
ncbi:MAG: YCF48-related protein [Acidobacteriota bacterium]|nr:YCF48-related protein [Acidobacteriota bacterium]